MSRTPRLFHPGFLRKVAVLSILGGLVISFALFGLRAFPFLLGAAEWAGVTTSFVPLVDVFFVVGVSAHTLAMVLVVRDRNPGLGRFVGRSFSGGRVQVVPPAGAVGATVDAAFESELDETLGETGEPQFGEPADESVMARLRGGWAQLRATMRSRRGPTPPPAATHDSDPTQVIHQLGSSSTSEDDDGR